MTRSDSVSADKGPGRKSRKWFTFFIAVFILCLFFVLARFANEWFGSRKIQSVKVEGNRNVSAEEITDFLKTAVKGVKRDSISLIRIENEILQFDRLLRVSARFSGADELVIYVEERQPVAIVKSGDGELKYLDSSGFFFSYSPVPDFANLPVVVGFESTEREVNRLGKPAASLIMELKKEKNYFVFSLLSELEFNTKHNEFNLITAGNNYKIRIGKSEYLDEKLGKYREFLSRWLRFNSSAEIRTIDLRWKNQIVIS